MWGSNDEVGAVTIDLNTLGEQSFTVRDGSGEAAPTWSERISGPGVAGTFNFRLLVTTDPNPATSVGVCLRARRRGGMRRPPLCDASSLRAAAASAAISARRGWARRRSRGARSSPSRRSSRSWRPPARAAARAAGAAPTAMM